jgi:formate hydrogenlyase subunit 3/multisubunit Na+/H+ antiporter MnhD subunit
MFAPLTKVGVYAVLRLWTLCFPESAGASAHFGGALLVWGGLATLAFGSAGMLRSQQLGRLAGYSIIASSGTVLAAAGLDVRRSRPAHCSTSAAPPRGGALFLLAELVERARQVEVDPPVPDLGERLRAFGEPAPADVNLDDRQVPMVGRVIPAPVAFLGASFLLCTLVVAGLPPLSGFVGKLAMLRALVDTRGLPAGVLFVLLIVSSLTASIALLRAFVAHFWAAHGRTAQPLRTVEVLPGHAAARRVRAAGGGRRACTALCGRRGRRAAHAAGVHRCRAGNAPGARTGGGGAMRRWIRPLPLAASLWALWLLLNDSLSPAISCSGSWWRWWCRGSPRSCARPVRACAIRSCWRA